MNRKIRLLIIGALILSFSSAFCGRAIAGKYNERRSWMANVGMGMGRGVFNDRWNSRITYVNGAVPQIRFGRMIGQHVMTNINYAGWMLEFDNPNLTQFKARRSLQNIGLGLTFFPGDPLGFWGGFYFRTGMGIGWTGTALVLVDPNKPQDHGKRDDDWGTGYFFETGWEWWMSSHSTIGVIGSFYAFDIDDDLVKEAWFGAISFTLAMYF